jgi:carbon storage regulator
MAARLVSVWGGSGKIVLMAGRCELMLVLSRRIGENIVIAGDIRVTVLAVSGRQVRLGIRAPSSVSVIRQELAAAGDSCKLKDGDNLEDDTNRSHRRMRS